VNQTGPSGPAGPSLLCRTGERVLAVPLDRVVETMRPLPVQSFPGSPRFVSGLARIRGRAIPVIDAGAMLGATVSRPRRFVTISVNDRTVALAVESVIGVQTLDAAGLAELPPLLGFIPPEALCAVGALDDDLLMVLGDAHLVPDSVWATLDGQVNVP
jgi:purine-binding chemotaxis protein CheW